MLGFSPLGHLPLGSTNSGSCIAQLDANEANDTVSATSAAKVTAVSAITESGDQLSSLAQVAIVGSGSITESPDAVTATTAITVAATLSASEQSDTILSISTVHVSASAALTSQDDVSAVVSLGLVPGGSSNFLKGDEAEAEGRRRRELQRRNDLARERARQARISDDAYQAMLARFRDDDFITFPLDQAVAQLRADEDDIIMALMLAA